MAKHRISKSGHDATDKFLARHFGSVDSPDAKKFNAELNFALTLVHLIGLTREESVREIPAMFAEKFGPDSLLTFAAQDAARAASLATNQAEYEALLAEGTVSRTPIPPTI